MEGQSIPVQRGDVALPIARVVGDRMADGTHVHPDLVGATGLELEPRNSPVGCDESLEHLIVGPSRASIRTDGHLCRRAR